MKYKILQDEFSGMTFYTVQYRSLWMWWDKTEFDYCVDGSCAGDSPKQFESIELATKFIEELHPKRKIVKYIEIN